MVKDDDLDLELDDEPVVSKPRPAAPAAARPAPAKPAPASAASPAARPAATPVTPRKGWLGNLSDSAAAVRGFTWNTRTFVWLLLVLVAIVLIAENWAPVRFYFFGFAFEMPKAISFILDLALGALLMWLWLRRSAHAAEAGK